MTRLVVIAGPERSGKTGLWMRLASEDPGILVLRRDSLRVEWQRLLDEANLTTLMGAMARHMLLCGHSVLAVGQHQHEMDRRMWEDVALSTGAELEWYDTAEPDVQALIPRAA